MIFMQASVPASIVKKRRGKEKGMSAKENTMQKIEEDRRDILENYTFAQHWEVRERTREFDAKIARMERLARTCGSYITDQSAMEISQQMYDLVDKLRSRWQLFGTIRNSFSSLIDKQLDPRDEQILKEADANTIVTILCQSFQMLTRCQIMEASIRSGSSLQFCIHVWDFKISTSVSRFMSSCVCLFVCLRV